MVSGQITKNRINLDLIEIIQFCLKEQSVGKQECIPVGCIPPAR